MSVSPTVESRPGTPRWVKLLGILIIAGLVLAGAFMLVSGGQHGPGIHTAQTGDASPSPSSVTEATVGGPAEASGGTRTIEIRTLDAMSFEPTSVSVGTGEVVTFVVTNSGQLAHEFTLGDDAMQVEHAAAMGHMPEGERHEEPNSIVVEPGQTRELTWRFGQAGILEYACHEPGHYDAGMRGSITVG